MTGFSAGTAARRRHVAGSDAVIDGFAINGIDYVEVIHSAAPSPDLRQRLLDVVFLKPDGVDALGPGNFEIAGGTRIAGIRVTAVSQTDPRSLRLTLSQAGDFSTYTLSVRQGPEAGDPPSHFDRWLASVAFGFKVECDTDFDCAEGDPPVPARPPAPPLDYLTRDWDGFRRLMLDRMSQTAPGLDERNPADLGVTLVETLADAADRVSWFQDATMTEAYWTRARFRQSVARHARLLGYRLSEGRNARTVVALDVDQARTPLNRPALARGTRFLTAALDPGRPWPAILPRDPEPVEDLIARGSVVFETMEDLPDLIPARNAMSFHDWGEPDACLPVGATRAWLRGPPADLHLRKGMLLVLEERIPAGGTPDDPPDPMHRQVVRLSDDPRPARDPVFDLDLTEIDWHPEDALRFALTLERPGGAPGAVARGNVVAADEGRRLDFGRPPGAAGEDAFAIATGAGILPDDGPGTAMRVRIDAARIVHAVPHDPATAAAAPATALLAQAGTPVADLTLSGAGETWTAQPDLLGSDRFAPHVAVESGAGLGIHARFGDGVLGRAPAAGTQFTARYREGGGTRGNVGADAIAHIVTDEGQRIAGVTNPLPASGGAEPEPVAAARVRAPQGFRTARRAVTPDDYATAARGYPGVQRAYARREWMGSWHVTTLAIDRIGGADVTRDFAGGLRAYLEARRLAGHDLRIVAPIFVPLDIALYVCVAPDAVSADVARALADLFSDRMLAGGQQGLFHPDRLEFGGDVLLSRLIAAAMSVRGVAWTGLADGSGATVGRFGRLDQPGIDFGDSGILPIAAGEIARLDNDPNAPEWGRMRFVIEGGR
jgi:hypothetical protein